MAITEFSTLITRKPRPFYETLYLDINMWDGLPQLCLDQFDRRSIVSAGHIALWGHLK